MPDSTDKEDHHDIQRPTGSRYPTAAKGNIDIITEPCGKRYMPSMFISGRDVAIDASFFINGLNADAETITIRTDDDETFVNFVVDGQRYTAKWYDWNNSIRITCDDLNYDEYEVADRKLYELSKRFTNDMFGDLIARRMVVWPEGDRPVLLVLLYEK